MGLFDRIREKIEETIETIEELKDSVVERVVETGKKWAQRIKDYLDSGGQDEKQKNSSGSTSSADNIHNKDDFKDSVRAGQRTIWDEEPDREVMKDAKELLKRKFPDGFQKTYDNMDNDVKIKTAEDLAYEAAIIFGCEGVNIEVRDPQSMDELCCYGSYRGDNTIFINATFLTYDDNEVSESVLFTVFHEMTHARQNRIIHNWKEMGYSEDKYKELCINEKYYVTSTEDDEVYYGQPMEVEARKVKDELMNYAKNNL